MGIGKMTKADTFLISIINLDIAPEAIIKDCIKIVKEFKKNNKSKDLTRPYSIVLTNNPGIEESKGELVSYDEIHNKKYFDRNNEAFLMEVYSGTSLKDLVKKLPFPFSIMRLSILPPDSIISMHTDASCHAQLAITTNKDCFVAARTGETHHIPVDGQLYIISTTIPHTAFNASSDERIHLSVSIYDEDYVKILKSSSLD